MQNKQVDHYASFEQLYAYAPLGMAIMSVDGAWLKVNPSLCRLLDFTETELTALTPEAISPSADYETEKEGIRSLLAGEISVFEMETRYHREAAAQSGFPSICR